MTIVQLENRLAESEPSEPLNWMDFETWSALKSQETARTALGYGSSPTVVIENGYASEVVRLKRQILAEALRRNSEALHGRSPLAPLLIVTAALGLLLIGWILGTHTGAQFPDDASARYPSAAHNSPAD